MPWAPSYATAEELAEWLGDEEDAQMSLVTESASRAIDQACGRQFGLSDEQTRVYPVERFRDRWTVEIDDCPIEPTVEGVDEFTLHPRNAEANGKPWTRIEYRTGPRDTVEVTATFGWANVPQAIKLACLIQAARFWERRDSTGGPLTQKDVDDVSYKWGAAAELDADVASSIAPYRRLSAAV